MITLHRLRNSILPEEAAASSHGRALRISGVLLLGVLLLLLVALGARTFASAQMSAQMFAYPFQFDESEGMIVAETLLLDRGTNIYEKPAGDLFVAAPYPPLYYLLAWPAQHMVGTEPSFKIGRALTMVATLAAGVCILGIVVALSGDLLAGLIAAALWWSLGLVAFWGSLVKPDMLAITLGLAGLWRVLARPPAQVWWALPFFIAAFDTKQTAIAAGVAVTGWLLVTRWRTGLIFGVLYGLGAILPGLVFDLLTNGGYYYHMFTVHNLPWFPGRFAEYAMGFVAAYGPFVVPGMLAVLALAVVWLVARLRGDAQLLPRDGALLLFFYFGM